MIYVSISSVGNARTPAYVLDRIMFSEFMLKRFEMIARAGSRISFNRIEAAKVTMTGLDYDGNESFDISIDLPAESVPLVHGLLLLAVRKHASDDLFVWMNKDEEVFTIGLLRKFASAGEPETVSGPGSSATSGLN